MQQQTGQEALYQTLKLNLHTFGITRLANISGFDELPIETMMAIRPNARGQCISLGTFNNKQMAGIAAIMEALELWYAEQPIHTDITGSYHQLAEDYLLKWPNLQSPSQPSAHRKEQIQDWIPFSQLGKHESVYLPKSHFNNQLEIKRQSPEISSCSIPGLACGHNLSIALSHGLFELIEQDCKMRFTDLFQANDYRLDISTLSSYAHWPLIQELIAKGIRLCVTDMQSELCVPCYEVILQIPTSKQKTDFKSFYGYGCDLDHDVALLKALFEAVQESRIYWIGCRDDIDIEWYSNDTETSLANKKSSHQPDWRFVNEDDSLSTLDRLQSRLDRFGYPDIYYLNDYQTELPVCIVRVVVPGLIIPQY